MATVDAVAPAKREMPRAGELVERPNPVVAAAGQILCVLVPLALWFAPLDLPLPSKHGLAIVCFMVIAWITQALEYALAGFVGCFLFWALGVVKFEVAFSGFANSTAWFLFAAFLFGQIASRSGLARRLAYSVMLRMGTSYARVLFGMIVTDFLLTFIVPSGLARVVILASIALALLDAFRAERGGNIARGLFLILTYTGNIFDKMIIAGAGTITATGLMAKTAGIEVSWALWLVAFLPCSIVTVLAGWLLTLWFYPPETERLVGRDHFRDELEKMGPWSPMEIRSAVLLGAAIALWVTDFIHHIPPVMIALGIGLFALLPHVGVLSGEDMRRVNYMPVFFVAAAVSMGNVLEATKGLDVLTNVVFAWIEPFLGNLITTTAVMYWTAFVYHFFLASEISMLGTSIPLVMEFAKTHGMNPLLLGMVWTFSAGGKLFAYQSGVLIVGYAYGYFSAWDLMRIGWWLTVVEFLVLIVLVPFYWPLLGIQ